MANGAQLEGPASLRKVIASHPEQFVRTFTEALMTYALGRGVESYDRCSVDAIVTRLNEHGNKFSELVLGIVESDPFLKRKELDGLVQN